MNSMEDLRRLLVEDGRQEMPLPLKSEMDNYHVFPKVDVIDGEPCILWETQMNGSTLDGQLRSFSEIHGFLNAFFSHQFRYGGGALLDQSGKNHILSNFTCHVFLPALRITDIKRRICERGAAQRDHGAREQQNLHQALSTATACWFAGGHVWSQSR